jgi:hypothetical protein
MNDKAIQDLLAMLNGMEGGFKPMSDAERRRRGMDPRDPNQVSVGPNGNVVTTLMGWAGMGDKLTPDQMNQMWDERIRTGKPVVSGGGQDMGGLLGGVMGSAAGSMIPKARPNKNGLTRLSPGVYRDASGNTVRKARG